MAITDFAAFGEMHVSVLQEIGNMGAGNAATALSDMISAPTDISVPQVKIISSAQASSLTDTLSAKTAAYLIGVNGDMRGAMLFIFPFDFIGRLACTYFPGTEVKKREDMNEMVLSVVQETVNIVAASYANNFAIMSGMMVDITVPESVTAPSEKIMAAVGKGNVCFINNSIEITDCKKSFNVLFFPELETIKDFMGRIGVPCE